MEITCRTARRKIEFGIWFICFISAAAVSQAGGRDGAGRGDGVSHDADRIQANCGSAWQPPCAAVHDRGQAEDNQTLPTPADEALHSSGGGDAGGTAGPIEHAVVNRATAAVRRPSDRIKLEGGPGGMRATANAKKGESRPKISQLKPPLPVKRPATINTLALVQNSSPIATNKTQTHQPFPTHQSFPVTTPLKQTAALTPPMTSSVPSDALILAENSGDVVRDCSSKDVIILAHDARFVLTGGCRSVTVSGNNNRVLVEMASGGELDVLRQSNSVVWTKSDAGTDPLVFSAGMANATVSLSIEPGSLPIDQPGSMKDDGAASASLDRDRSDKKNPFSEMSQKIPQEVNDLVVLSSNDDKVIRDCANKDVSISASSSNIVLTGGCRSVTISGSKNKILAEIVGGGELTVLQSENAVAWTKFGTSTEQVLVHATAQNRLVELTADAKGEAPKQPAP
jgi:Protein of unknown function (DUF3060)